MLKTSSGVSNEESKTVILKKRNEFEELIADKSTVIEKLRSKLKTQPSFWHKHGQDVVDWLSNELKSDYSGQ